jgi:hypothetical protein
VRFGFSQEEPPEANFLSTMKTDLNSFLAGELKGSPCDLRGFGGMSD